MWVFCPMYVPLQLQLTAVLYKGNKNNTAPSNCWLSLVFLFFSFTEWTVCIILQPPFLNKKLSRQQSLIAVWAGSGWVKHEGYSKYIKSIPSSCVHYTHKLLKSVIWKTRRFKQVCPYKTLMDVHATTHWLGTSIQNSRFRNRRPLAM